LKLSLEVIEDHLVGRVPRGARGLKPTVPRMTDETTGRVPRGARGLKLDDVRLCPPCEGRVPRGARGLKPRETVTKEPGKMSRPARGAWIETWPV